MSDIVFEEKFTNDNADLSKLSSTDIPKKGHFLQSSVMPQSLCGIVMNANKIVDDVKKHLCKFG